MLFLPSSILPRQRQEDTVPKLISSDLVSIGANLVVGFLILGLCAWLAPSALPLGIFELWEMKGSLSDWLYTALPLFLWGPALSTTITLRRGPQEVPRESAEEVLLHSACSSLRAGVLEEIWYRWILFIDTIPVMMFVNWLFFGWASNSFGLVAAIHNWLFGPVANWLTLGYLSPWLVNPDKWFIGASLISCNTMFRDGHAYQGWVGLINSWFGGMFLFFLLFKYGLVACIICHFLYNLSIGLTMYFLRKLNLPRPMTIGDYLKRVFKQ